MSPPAPLSKPDETPETSYQPQMTDAITVADLSSYMSAPTAERTASVEAWICSQLDDDGFHQLCQDMEGIWRRVGFGR
ncbi:hypothetical protein BO70DRAFT_363194 [Aspergillus heteromorphus CBS 117.55]|uniref:Uncharacterized protein n=1 Tax=Aspergillus heteromorphus CBS 117.55 TaxID=1448321 RepID=A0A317VVA6_9EURO|nr:uncharacterized protein BO70DRAFT_363194 [Aspergillus heteromorphus CBS 117.55]PWY78316.1 hypothetical protein BO70DRAFT_363194 [Aspergillus heteromorphus CBS 117.55]